MKNVRDVVKMSESNIVFCNLVGNLCDLGSDPSELGCDECAHVVNGRTEYANYNNCRHLLKMLLRGNGGLGCD